MKLSIAHSVSRRSLGLALLLGLFAYTAQAAPKIDFINDVKPVLEFNCVSCHWAEKAKGRLRLDTWDEAKGSIIPGKPMASSLYRTCILPADDDEVMPPQEGPDPYLLTKAEIDVLNRWITEGATWPEGLALTPQKRLPSKVTFVEHIQPILELNCVKCHWEKKDKGGLRLDTKALAMAADLDNPLLVAGNAFDSSIYWTTCLPEDDDLRMPPEGNDPLTPKSVAMLRRWVEEGADWPADITLMPRKPASDLKGIDPVELYNKLGFKPGPVTNLMTSYSVDIAPTGVNFEMMPVGGGTFEFGGSDDVDAHKVFVSPFWMGKTEVRWDEYDLWMSSMEKEIRDHKKLEPNANDLLADIVTRPTPPYRPDMIFEPGKEGYPAVCITQLSARMYTMWLSAKTGRFFRLATAAEWEFASRGGAKTPYYFGEDEDLLGDYEWFEDNSDYTWHPVGQKKANPYGIHDMLGNVSEWVLDDFDLYTVPAKGLLINPLRIPDEEYNRTVRGGNWNVAADECTVTARDASNNMWKMQDPQFPQSVWHFTDALFVGFRVVSPLNVPPPEEITKYWPSRQEIEDIPAR